MSDAFIVWLTTNPVVTTWLIKHVASPLDPLIFKATNGRFTSMGPPAMPMLTLTTVGRHSGQPRSVHLACLEHEGDYLVVASAMGQERHPAGATTSRRIPRWRSRCAASASPPGREVLTDDEKEKVWPDVKRAIPQMNVYEKSAPTGTSACSPEPTTARAEIGLDGQASEGVIAEADECESTGSSSGPRVWWAALRCGHRPTSEARARRRQGVQRRQEGARRR